MPRKKRRKYRGTWYGFASMDLKEQRKIASMGGKAVHEQGTGHEYTKQEARIAGRKGGRGRKAKKKGDE